MQKKSPSVRVVGFHLDAFRMSFAVARATLFRLAATLQSIEPRHAATGSYDDAIASAFADAWTLVDVIHRVRDLADQSPLVRARAPEVVVFRKRTAPAEELRHHVQHFRSGITKLPSTTTPLWGALSWVSTSDDQKCFTLFSGTMVPDVECHGCVYDTATRSFTQRLLLTAAGYDLELDQAVDAILKLQTHIAARFVAGDAPLKAPLGLAFSWKLKFPEA